VPTANEIRAWARGEGLEVNLRGNIPGDIREQYDAAHPGSNGSSGSAGPDYPDDDFETAFADVPGDDDFPDAVLPPAGTGETAPRRPKASTSRRSPTKGGKHFWQRGGAPKTGKGKKPRVSTEDLLGSLWRGAAKLASPLPPLQRTLRIQAPVAGLLLEDAVKGTAADVVMQPFARLAGQGKVVSALLGPPVIVTALTVHAQQRAAAGEEPNPVFVSVGIEVLRSSLMTWCEIAGPKFEVALRREQEVEARFGQSVDDLISLLLSPPVDLADQAAVMAEEEAIRRAQGIVTVDM
jgi:hypothetical protein